MADPQTIESPLVAENVVQSYKADRVPDGLRAYPTQKTKFSWDRVFDVAKLYAEGASTYEIASRLKMSRTTVTVYLDIHEKVQQYNHKARDQMQSLLGSSRHLMLTTWDLLRKTLESDKPNPRDAAALIMAINAAMTAQARLQGLGGDAPQQGSVEILTVIVKDAQGTVLQETTIGKAAQPVIEAPLSALPTDPPSAQPEPALPPPAASTPDGLN